MVAITIEKGNAKYPLVTVNEDDFRKQPKNDDFGRVNDDDFRNDDGDDFRGKLYVLCSFTV